MIKNVLILGLENEKALLATIISKIENLKEKKPYSDQSFKETYTILKLKYPNENFAAKYMEVYSGAERSPTMVFSYNQVSFCVTSRFSDI
jgi:hypothetical protein